MSSSSFHHVTVLEQQAVEMLSIKPEMTVIDCTAGGGGHTELILSRLEGSGLVVAFDQDQQAITHLRSRFASEIDQGIIKLVDRNFAHLRDSCDQMKINSVQGILADIGVSSPQIDDGNRGFSFMSEGPLDMRMDQNSEPTAEEVVNNSSEKELSDIFWRLGEEPKARAIAKAIVAYREDRPIKTTSQLAELVKDAARYPTKSRKHPATKTFQALRIHVNRELAVLEELINDGFELLSPGGRLAIITFHSLEDRIVKRAFKKLSQTTIPQSVLRNAPLKQTEIDASKRGKIIKPFPEIPSNEEIEQNPRSRSAKLRVIEKI